MLTLVCVPRLVPSSALFGATGLLGALLVVVFVLTSPAALLFLATASTEYLRLLKGG